MRPSARCSLAQFSWHPRSEDLELGHPFIAEAASFEVATCGGDWANPTFVGWHLIPAPMIGMQVGGIAMALKHKTFSSSPVSFWQSGLPCSSVAEGVRGGTVDNDRRRPRPPSRPPAEPTRRRKPSPSPTLPPARRSTTPPTERRPPLPQLSTPARSPFRRLRLP